MATSKGLYKMNGRKYSMIYVSGPLKDTMPFNACCLRILGTGEDIKRQKRLAERESRVGMRRFQETEEDQGVGLEDSW